MPLVSLLIMLSKPQTRRESSAVTRSCLSPNSARDRRATYAQITLFAPRHRERRTENIIRVARRRRQTRAKVIKHYFDWHNIRHKTLCRPAAHNSIVENCPLCRHTDMSNSRGIGCVIRRCKLQRGIMYPILWLFWHICMFKLGGAGGRFGDYLYEMCQFATGHNNFKD